MYNGLVSCCYIVARCHIALIASTLQARVLLGIKEVAGPVVKVSIGLCKHPSMEHTAGRVAAEALSGLK